MLEAVSTFLLYHQQAARASFQSLKNKPMTTLITVAVIGITLTLPTLFWVFSGNLQQLTMNWERGGHISLFLERAISPSDEQALLNQVQKIPGVRSASLKSAAEGLAQLQQEDGMQDFMRYLPENPLPSVIDVMPVLDLKQSDQLVDLHQRLKALSHIEQSSLDLQWVHEFFTVLNMTATIAHGLMVLLATAVVFIIGNTLRMSVYHRRDEIEILKLIGAGKAYIRRPFLYMGVFYGTAGALFALILVALITSSLGKMLNQLAEISQMDYTVSDLSSSQSLLLLLGGMFMGWIGTMLSVR